MNRSHAAVWCVAAALGCLTARSLAAHHGTLVSYDRDKAWTAKAVVTEFRYVNPHAQIYFDVKDKDHAGQWSGELLPNPAQLIASGWTRKRSNEMLKAGTPITITEEILGAAPPPGAAAPRPVP
jgi:hypothetical protein